MRRHVAWFPIAVLAVATLAPAARMPAHAQAQAPHAWLFGEWTGGIFPAPANIAGDVCRSVPTVIFTRDVVLRAQLTEPSFVQRVIETARSDSSGTTFHFAPAPAAPAPANPLLGAIAAPPSSTGFGCPDPDGLRVTRQSENEIVFPDCKDFPNPLVRCR